MDVARKRLSPRPPMNPVASSIRFSSSHHPLASIASFGPLARRAWRCSAKNKGYPGLADVRVLILGVAPQYVAGHEGAAALPWVSVPSVPKCTWALHPLLLVEGTASQERQLRCLLRPGFGWVVVRACLLPLLAPRPRQPSGGHHISSGSNAALPRASTVALFRSHYEPECYGFLTAKMVRT